jgi:hypothetical protein
LKNPPTFSRRGAVAAASALKLAAGLEAGRIAWLTGAAGNGCPMQGVAAVNEKPRAQGHGAEVSVQTTSAGSELPVRR